MSIITYFGRSEKGLFAFSKASIVEKLDYYDLNNRLCDIVGKDNNYVFIRDFKSGKNYKFLKSGDMITTQTKRIDLEGTFLQLESTMVGRPYDPIKMQALFE